MLSCAMFVRSLSTFVNSCFPLMDSGCFLLYPLFRTLVNKEKGRTMKRKGSMLLWLLIGLFTMTINGFADEKTPENEFRVGMETAYAPFNWTQTTDANGAVLKNGEKGAYAGGYDVEMAKKIADGLGKDLVVVPIQWDGLVPALKSGKIDAIIAGMSPTEERRKEIDFTE